MIFFLFFVNTAGVFSQYILTDAAGGTFTQDQRPAFVLARPGILRLLLDGREIYRGEGPAYPELGLAGGEQRGFTLTSEYYSTGGSLLESRSWHIYIDKKPPELGSLEFRNTKDGLRFVHSGAEPNIKIRAWADANGKLVFYEDLLTADIFPPCSFNALVWAEDLAGNCSAPRCDFFEIPLLKIENPAAGEWLNRQILLITGAEGKNIFWTADGTNPLESGGTGRLYRGPERIEKTGHVSLRIAWYESSGRPREEVIDYYVRETREDSAGQDFEISLNALQNAEENTIVSALTLELPSGSLWSTDGIRFHQYADGVTLRPQRLVNRAALLHLSLSGSSGSGMYRFAYLLDGNGGRRENNRPSLDETVLAESVIMPDAAGETPAYAELPRLVSAGRSRLIIWPKTGDAFYHAWEGRDNWQEGNRPLPVPLEGGTLRWFISGGEAVYATRLAPVRQTEETAFGRIACRNFEAGGGWKYVSDILDYIPGIIKNRPADNCDGEDLEWAFIGSGGEIFERSRRDRSSPAAPDIEAPAEGEWTRGPARVSAVPAESNVFAFVNARLRYASGAVEFLSGTGSLDIVSSGGEPAEVTVECFVIDASENRSPSALRNFIVDPKTIYVSSEPLYAGTAAPSSERGGMYNPCASLEEALEYAARQDSSCIKIAGNCEIIRPASISGNIHIDGRWKDENSFLRYGDGFSWDIAPDASLTLSNIRSERSGGNNPLIRAGTNARVSFNHLELNNSGPLLLISGGILDIRNSKIISRVYGEQRIAAAGIQDSAVHIDNSRIQTEGNYSLLFYLEGGSFSALNSALLSAGTRTASVFTIRETKTELLHLTLQAAARDYASVLEAQGHSNLLISGGNLGVSANDTSALVLDDVPAIILGAQFTLEGSFTAKAIQINGHFPWVEDSGFSSAGIAEVSEIFSALEQRTSTEGIRDHTEVYAETSAGISAPEFYHPQNGSITGNRFFGFTHIWGLLWPMDKLHAFNRSFAAPERPNNSYASLRN